MVLRHHAGNADTIVTDDVIGNGRINNRCFIDDKGGSIR